MAGPSSLTLNIKLLYASVIEADSNGVAHGEALIKECYIKFGVQFEGARACLGSFLALPW